MINRGGAISLDDRFLYEVVKAFPSEDETAGSEENVNKKGGTV